LQLGSLSPKFRQRFWRRQHFISVAHHAFPVEITNAIYDLRWIGSSVSEIAAVEDQVRGCRPQIDKDCIKRSPVAMDVRHDGDAHLLMEYQKHEHHYR
jgi:hypothetical protein